MISPVMSTEERLRAATRAAADTVAPGSAPPLRLPDDPAAGPLRGGRSRRRRWLRALTPLAAAAAVAAAVIVSLAADQRRAHVRRVGAEPCAGRRRWPACRRTTSRWPGSPDSPAARDHPGHGHREGAGHGDAAPALQRVHVRERRGRRPHVRPGRPALVEDHVRDPGTGRAAADNTTPVAFFRLRFDPATRTARLTPAALSRRCSRPRICPASRCPPTAPSSPSPCTGQDRGLHARHRIGTVLGLARRWPLPPAAWVGNDKPDGEPLSWTADGRTLAFQLWHRVGRHHVGAPARHHHRPGGSLRAARASRQLRRPRPAQDRTRSATSLITAGRHQDRHRDRSRARREPVGVTEFSARHGAARRSRTCRDAQPSPGRPGTCCGPTASGTHR